MVQSLLGRKRGIVPVGTLACLLVGFVFVAPVAHAAGAGHSIVPVPGGVVSPVLAANKRSSIPPHPAPTCFHHSCDFQNPYQARCAGQWWDSWWEIGYAPVHDPWGRLGGWVELWWSETCQTNWAEVYVWDQIAPAHPWVSATLYSQRGSFVALALCQHPCKSLTGNMLYLPQQPACASGFLNMPHMVQYSGWISQYPHPATDPPDDC
jgi:hypothetical protein